MTETNSSDDNPYKGLEALIEKYCDKQEPHVFLHPPDYGISAVSRGLRGYTDDELKALDKRDFETRLFFSEQTFEGDSVWLQTHFSDNHIHQSEFNKIRDYIKAAHYTKNHTAAKAILAEILTTCIEMDNNSYYSFAITIASGLSNMGSNSSFQRDLVSPKRQYIEDSFHTELCLIMHIIFGRIGNSNFLFGETGNNIYRLVHCKTTTSQSKSHYDRSIAFFCFILQIFLTVYVIFDCLKQFKAVFMDKSEDVTYTQLPLAIVASVYSGIVAYPVIMEGTDGALKIYPGVGIFSSMDYIVNTILPIILVIFGFFTNFFSDTFINSVLNTAALLFIPEIDDQLPNLLGYSESGIFKAFLLHESMSDYDKWGHLEPTKITTEFLKGLNDSIGVQFSDFYLTNTLEQGPNPDGGVHFNPYMIRKGRTIDGETRGHQISPKNIVTDECLIRKIVWSYTTGFASSIKPRIGYLRLEMVNGEIIEYNLRDRNHDIVAGDRHQELEGVFIITSFQMSDTILRLRVCGSYSADDFVKAFDYYSLWKISKNARRSLAQHQKYQNAHKIDQHYKSFVGNDGYRSVIYSNLADAERNSMTEP